MHPILRFYPPHTIQQPTHHIVIPQKYRALSDILARKKKEIRLGHAAGFSRTYESESPIRFR